MIVRPKRAQSRQRREIAEPKFWPLFRASHLTPRPCTLPSRSHHPTYTPLSLPPQPGYLTLTPAQTMSPATRLAVCKRGYPQSQRRAIALLRRHALALIPENCFVVWRSGLATAAQQGSSAAADVERHDIPVSNCWSRGGLIGGIALINGLIGLPHRRGSSIDGLHRDARGTAREAQRHVARLKPSVL